MELRRKEFHMRCGLIGMIVGSMYETLLSCRHFRGHLEISHSQRTIRIVVSDVHLMVAVLFSEILTFLQVDKLIRSFGLACR